MRFFVGSDCSFVLCSTLVDRSSLFVSHSVVKQHKGREGEARCVPPPPPPPPCLYDAAAAIAAAAAAVAFMHLENKVGGREDCLSACLRQC